MANSKMVDKWEFNKGEETVYTSALDIFGEKENHALGACLPAMGKLMGEFGWGLRLSDLTEDKIKRLIITTILEFEKNMKLEQIPDGDNPLFFDIKVSTPIPDGDAEKAQQAINKAKDNVIPPPNVFGGGLIPDGTSLAPMPDPPRTGPVTDADMPWPNPTDPAIPGPIDDSDIPF